MSNRQKLGLLAGVVLIASAAGLAFTHRSFFDQMTLDSTVTAILPTVSGLRVGQAVTLFDDPRRDPGERVIIGNVLRFDRASRGVRVSIALDGSTALRESARAVFQPSNVAGGASLMIDPGTIGGALVPGAELPAMMISASPDGLLEPPPRWIDPIERRVTSAAR